MKKTILLLAVLVRLVPALAQKDTSSFLLDASLKATTDTGAVYIARSFPSGNQWAFIVTNRQTSKVVLNSSYAEPELKTLVGTMEVFYDNGRARSKGGYENGLPSGLWEKWDEEGLLTDSLIYQEGKTALSYKCWYDDAGGLRSSTFTDYRSDSVHNCGYQNGKLISDMAFKGLAGESKTFYPSGRLSMINRFDDKGKSVFQEYYAEDGSVVSEKEQKKAQHLVEVRYQKSIDSVKALRPEFNGGPAGFQLFLDQNLTIPSSVSNKISHGDMIRFSMMLDKKGRAYDVKLISPYYTELEKSLRQMMQVMPYWEMKGLEKYGPIVCDVRVRL